MWCAIYFIVILQLLFSTPNAEPLRGRQIQDVTDGEFSFVASLQHYDGRHFCSGALITKQNVITAAHCLTNEKPENVWVVLGLIKLRPVPMRYSVLSWLTYDAWADSLCMEKETIIHDIAILKLRSQVNQQNVNHISLSLLNKKQFQGKKAIVLGWVTHEHSKELKKGLVTVLSDDDCQRNILLIANEEVTTGDRLICTFADPYILLHHGDSGAPLIDRHHMLIGINSGDGPETKHAWGNFSEEFLRKYQMNLHYNVDHYRHFIFSATTYL